MPLKVGDEVIENIELLPPPWFGVSHGFDNYEEAIRLDEIQAWRAGYDCNNGTWTFRVQIILKGGNEFVMLLSEKGYESFLTAIAMQAEGK